MKKKICVAAALLALLAFAIPIEYKYHKLFRFFSLTLVPQGLQISESYDKFIYFYLSDLAAIALLLMALFWFRISPKRFFGNPLWVVFACALFSIIASPFASYPLPYTRLLPLLTPIALFSFLATAFTNEEKPKITRIIFTALFAAGLFQTGIAIAQYFHQAPLGLHLLGEPSDLPYFYIQDGSRWIIDQIFHRETTLPIVLRASGTLPHSNVFGGFLLLSIVSTYLLIMQAEKRRWLLSLTLPLQLFALSISYSRSAIFAWILSTIVWIAMISYQKGFKQVRYLALFAVLSFAIITAALFKQYQSRGGIFNYNKLAQDSDQTRHFHQKIALNIIKDHPLWGLGFSQFSERAPQYFPEDTPAHDRLTGPHNIFLFLACETGLISLFALLSLIVFLLQRAVRIPITVETAACTAILIGFLFISCCDFYPLLFQQGKLMFFLPAGLLAMHVQRRRTETLAIEEAS